MADAHAQAQAPAIKHFFFIARKHVFKTNIDASWMFNLTPSYNVWCASFSISKCRFLRGSLGNLNACKRMQPNNQQNAGHAEHVHLGKVIHSLASMSTWIRTCPCKGLQSASKGGLRAQTCLTAGLQKILGNMAAYPMPHTMHNLTMTMQHIELLA